MMKGTGCNTQNLAHFERQKKHTAGLQDRQKSEVDRKKSQRAFHYRPQKEFWDFILITTESHWQALSLGVTRWDLIKHNSFSFRTQYIFK